MRKWLLMLVLFGLFVLAACGGSNDEGESEEVTVSGDSKAQELIFALDQTEKDTWVQATQKFAELVEEKTNGSINVSVHHSGTLGSQREVLEGILNGTMHGTASLEPLSYWVEDINLFGIPYLFDDKEHLKNFMNSEYGEELNGKLIDNNFRPLGYFDRPPRQITSNKPIDSIEDLQELTIRVPETATAPPAFEAMGASPTAMPFSELYNALETGTIDAQENPLPTIHANNLHEVQSHIAWTNHQYQAVYFIISEETYQSLSDEDKVAVDEAAEEAIAYEADLLADNLETIEQDLIDYGITFTEPDVAQFSSAAHDAYSGYDDLMQEWVEKVQSLR